MGMRELAAGSVALILTDPPYGIGYASTRGETVANDERPYIWWLHEASRIARDPSSLVCFHRWDVADLFRQSIEAAGFRVASQIVWDKLSGGMGDTARQFAPRHELCWHATKGKAVFPGRRPESVLAFPRPPKHGRTHPTEKPVDLLVHIIESLTEPGDLVVDPFSGTGSCAVACAKTGRRFVGWELNEGYTRTANWRVEQELAQSKLW